MLRDVKRGDLIATVEYGWVKVRETQHYGIFCGHNKSFFTDGKRTTDALYPTAFAESNAPQWLIDIIGPAPCEFVEDDPVLVWDDGGTRKYKAHFSHKESGKYHCYENGKTSWTTCAGTEYWDNCEHAQEPTPKNNLR